MNGKMLPCPTVDFCAAVNTWFYGQMTVPLGNPFKCPKLQYPAIVIA